MQPSSRIPPLLQQYIRLRRDAPNVLLTSTLGASANWLIIRYIFNALSNTSTTATEHSQTEPVEQLNVLLVSWLRDFTFWKQEVRKGVGVDLEKSRKEGSFAFVDGLKELCLSRNEQDEMKEDVAGRTLQRSPVPEVRPVNRVSQMGPIGLARGGLPMRRSPAMQHALSAATTSASAPSSATTTAQTSNGSGAEEMSGLPTITSPDLQNLQTTLTTALASLRQDRRTLLILDSPDTHLALFPSCTPSSLTSLVLSLQASTPSLSHVLVHMHADHALISPSSPVPQPLEIAHRNLLVKMAFVSQRVLGVRVLDTGVARDVGGVLRGTACGGLALDLDFNGDGNVDDEDGVGEVLYKVEGDGSVRVFERGSG